MISAMNDTKSTIGKAQTFSKIGKIVRVLLGNPEATLSQVAKVTGLSKATVQRYWYDARTAVELRKNMRCLDMANPPRAIQVLDMEVHYRPQDYDDEFLGGSYKVVDLPEVYIYARQDDKLLDGDYAVTRYEVNWGCCGSVSPEMFGRWVALCTFVSAQVVELESRLNAKRSVAAAIESQKLEQA